MKDHRIDLVAILLLLSIFTALYFYSVQDIPSQVSTDEVLDMLFIKELKSNNPFDVDTYGSLPRFQFLMYGFLANLLGGVNLYNLRLTAAATGILIIVLSYFFFKIFFHKTTAFAASILLGTSHVFLVFTKSMFRLSIPLVILFALGLLLKNIEKPKPILNFLGGILIGMSFYLYYSARAIVLIWLIFLITLIILRHKRWLIFRQTLIPFLVSFIIVILPITIATLKAPQDKTVYTRKQLLIYPEGREEQKFTLGVKSTFTALKTNVIDTFTSFNLNIPDRSFIYSFNYKTAAFLDPISGLLFWIGFIALILKKKRTSEEIFLLTGFISLVLLFAFVTNRSPHYSRMLIILPFCIILTIFGITFLLNILQIGHKFRVVLFWVFIALITLMNISIFGNYVMKGLTQGDAMGLTTRYIEKRKNIDKYLFLVAANESYPYIFWGNHRHEWLKGVISPHQVFEYVNPEDMDSFSGKKPFTLFMSKSLWLRSADRIRLLYPNLVIHNIKPDGSLVAIEVK